MKIFLQPISRNHRLSGHDPSTPWSIWTRLPSGDIGGFLNRLQMVRPFWEKDSFIYSLRNLISPFEGKEGLQSRLTPGPETPHLSHRRMSSTLDHGRYVLVSPAVRPSVTSPRDAEDVSDVLHRPHERQYDRQEFPTWVHTIPLNPFRTKERLLRQLSRRGGRLGSLSTVTVKTHRFSGRVSRDTVISVCVSFL